MRRFLKACFFCTELILFIIGTAWAQIPLKGYFIAANTCEAVQSIKKGTNPGNIHLVPDMSYELVAKNKEEATHYRIRVKHASPMERWVSASCGFILTDCSHSGIQTESTTSQNSSSPEFLLAISWQPAFCQTHQKKAECQSQDQSRYDADHFTLHGLWPQPESNIYCHTSDANKHWDEQNRWDRLPQPELSPATRKALAKVMPGTLSDLHRHEWIKHGTCYSPTEEEYFMESILLTEQINASVVRDYFSGNIGKTIPVSEIKAKFDQAFGPGAGDKVKVKCSNGMITELWINLKGEITSLSDLSFLIQSAKPAASSCPSGRVDPVGF